MKKELPLWHKLYFSEPYVELARVIGYRGVPVTEAQAKALELAKKHTKEVVAKAAEEIVRIDDAAKPPMAYLKDHVKPLCWQLLGPPPEMEDSFYRHPDGTPIDRPAKQSEKTPDPPPRTRKKK